MDNQKYHRVAIDFEAACDAYLESCARLPKSASFEEKMLVHRNFAYVRDQIMDREGITIEDFLEEMHRRTNRPPVGKTNQNCA